MLECVRRIQLFDIRLGEPQLIGRGVEHGRTICVRHRAPGGSIPWDRAPPKRRREQLAIRYLGRVINHLHRFRVSGLARANDFIVRSLLFATGVAGDCALNPFHVLKHGLHSPEAAAREDDRFLSRLRSQGRVGRRGRNRFALEPFARANDTANPTSKAAVNPLSTMIW